MTVKAGNVVERKKQEEEKIGVVLRECYVFDAGDEYFIMSNDCKTLLAKVKPKSALKFEEVS